VGRLPVRLTGCAGHDLDWRTWSKMARRGSKSVAHRRIKGSLRVGLAATVRDCGQWRSRTNILSEAYGPCGIYTIL